MDPLSSNSPKNLSQTYASASKHSTLVRRLRIILPLFAIVAVLGLVIKSLFFQKIPSLPNLEKTNVSIQGTKITMNNPVLKGFGKGQKPYEMKAQKAEQDIKSPDVIDLKVLDANIALSEGGEAKIMANKGSYNSKSQKLDLSSNVNINAQSKGYILKLSSASVDFKNNTMTSNEPVVVEMTDGNINANSMSVVDNGNKVVFEGNVKMTLMPKSPKPNSGS